MIAWFLALVLGCAEEPAATPPAPPPAATPAPAAAVTPPTTEIRVPPTTDRRFAARHILVTYQGAVGALPTITRTKEEARARVEEAKAKIAGGADFAEMAKAYSDDSTGPRGGDLGGFDEGTMVKPFEAALRLLKPGEISPVVETEFGFHLIQRQPLVEIHAAHLMVSWAGADKAPAGVTRTKEEAKARAEAARAEALAGGKDWDALVLTYSDGPLKEDGGDLGWFGRRQLAPQLDDAAFQLDIGALSEVVETPRGYHLLKRLE